MEATTNLADYFNFKQFTLGRIGEDETDETVALINLAYSYQDQAKGAPRTNPAHLWSRAAETDFYVVKDGGVVVGCVYLEPRDRSLHFGLLTVATRFRGTGLARAMMSAVESFARQQNYKFLDLDYMSLAPWLEKYYEGYGFKRTGEVTTWGAIDLIHMSKSLES